MKERIMREKMNNAKLFDVFLFLCLCSRDKRKNIERKKIIIYSDSFFVCVYVHEMKQRMLREKNE